MGQVDENTRLVASWRPAHFISGYRLEPPGHREIFARARFLLCLTRFQTLGAFPTTVEHVRSFRAEMQGSPRCRRWWASPCCTDPPMLLVAASGDSGVDAGGRLKAALARWAAREALA